MGFFFPLGLNCSFFRLEIGFFHCHLFYSIDFCFTSSTQHRVLPKYIMLSKILEMLYMFINLISFIHYCVCCVFLSF
jgi:hypothetical protein